jgi:hypothetical protein
MGGVFAQSTSAIAPDNSAAMEAAAAMRVFEMENFMM